MQTFKDTVALEECPAKTAESVSYGAVFIVLGWLLVSNYPELGHPELDVSAIADTDLPIINAAPPAVIADAKILNKTQVTVITLTKSDMKAEISNFVPAAPAWHTEIEQFERQPYLRTFSTATWGMQTSDAGQKIEGLIKSLDLPLPLIDANYLLNAKGKSDTITVGDLTNNQPAKDELVSKISLTGAETKRLSSRPVDIQRPEIPRPYRAQELQRSFVLPPRIRAFRP